MVHASSVRTHRESAGEDTGRAYSRNSPTKDEGEGVGGHGRDDGTNLKDGYRRHENPLNVELAVELAEHQLEAAGREEVRGSVPGDVGQRVELCRDLGDSRGQDGAVLNREKMMMSLVPPPSHAIPASERRPWCKSRFNLQGPCT
jgi:hypothetical protein